MEERGYIARRARLYSWKSVFIFPEVRGPISSSYNVCWRADILCKRENTRTVNKRRREIGPSQQFYPRIGLSKVGPPYPAERRQKREKTEASTPIGVS